VQQQAPHAQPPQAPDVALGAQQQAPHAQPPQAAEVALGAQQQAPHAQPPQAAEAALGVQQQAPKKMTLRRKSSDKVHQCNAIHLIARSFT
jgi:hypothetical protein